MRLRRSLSLSPSLRLSVSSLSALGPLSIMSVDIILGVDLPLLNVAISSPKEKRQSNRALVQIERKLFCKHYKAWISVIAGVVPPF